VAVFVLFVVGAMAALSIDVTTMYTARSEAQLAVDSAALAGARVLANSGATSDPNSATDGLMAAAQRLAKTVAKQVAEQNKIGGNPVSGLNLTPAIFFGGPWFNPTITVNVKVSNLPTFFARVWGRTTLAVAAFATAEAYNPSGANNGALGQTATPVAPLCVKPWLLPNMDPSNSGKPIFDSTTGAITTGSNLLGWSSSSAPTPTPMNLSCPGGDCTTLPAPTPWQYYPGNNDATSFPEPTFSLPTCSQIGTPTAYQYSIAGCIQMPISCNSNNVNIDMADDPGRFKNTANAVNCLTNAANGGDTVTTTDPPNQAIEFVAGSGSPAAVANSALIGQDVMVSNSLVTVPVINNPPGTPVNPVTIIGFVQLFLNPDGNPAPNNGPTMGNVNTTVINVVGCGTSATGTPIILGNGVSPVAVRLITR
jgi:Flp pilus assembly protein TadG